MFKNTPLKEIVLLWLGWAIILVGFQHLVVTRFDVKRPDRIIGWTEGDTNLATLRKQLYLNDPFLNPLVAWDSEYYLSIAVKGYDDAEVDFVVKGAAGYSKNYAFFPLYPKLMKALALPLQWLGMTPIATATLAGLIISLLGTLAGMIALYDLASAELSQNEALRAVFYLLIFPTGFFLAQIYTEGLFIGLAFSALALMRRGAQGQRYLLAAAVLSALAVLTRAVGGALAPALLISQWAQAPKGGRWKALGLGALYALLPLGAYLGWSYSPWGHAFRFVEQNFFGRSTLAFGTSLQGWGNAWNIVIGKLDSVVPWTLGIPAQSRIYYTMEFLVVGLGLLAAILVARRHPEAAVFSLGAWAIAVFSGYPQSNLRYMLALPAIFLLLGRWGKNPAFDRLWTILSLLLMGLFAALYAFDFWVA
jgi:hypothetical protein